MDIGKKIKTLRLAKPLTQNELAGILGVSKSTMSNYERNISTPDPEIIIKLAQYFDVTVDFLFHDKPEKARDFIKEGNNYTADKSLSKDEYNLLHYYRRLNDEQKDYIKGQMIQLYQKFTPTEKADKG